MRRAATIAGRGIWGQLGNGRPLTVGDGGRVGGRHALDHIYAEKEVQGSMGPLRRSLVPLAISVHSALALPCCARAEAKKAGSSGQPRISCFYSLFVQDAENALGDRLPFVDLGTGARATMIASGARHSCAVLDDGRLKCWGALTPAHGAPHCPESSRM